MKKDSDSNVKCRMKEGLFSGEEDMKKYCNCNSSCKNFNYKL